MKAENQYYEDYQTLHLSPGCSIEELRKSYKILIQKWHPDRFGSDALKQKAADDKIKLLNAAYSALVNFHKKNGYLPRSEAPKPRPRVAPKSARPASPAPERRTQTAPQPNTTTESVSANPLKKRRKASVILSAVMVAVLLYVIDQYSVQQPAKDTDAGYTPPKQENRNEPADDTGQAYDLPRDTPETIDENPRETDKKKKHHDEKYFTYGSSIGEVITIQGPPTKVDGNIWYYGESRVYFEAGKVVSWVREPGIPLKAKVVVKLPDSYQ